MPDLGCKNRDFFFIPVGSERQLQEIVAGLITQRLPQNMGIPADQIQVLTPTRKGLVGTWELNDVLQSSLNPPQAGKKEKKFGNFSFREGDRVMQIRNNYDIMWRNCDSGEVGTGIFNGDVGIIRSVDTQEELLTVDFDDRQAEYEFEALGELEPAYAMTVHKSQGSEYRAVILCAWHGSPYLLSRSVLYTAVTRAKELLVIVGREEVIAAMTENTKGNRRYTGLKLRLTN
jgi:exodeoxyribonuclease V alpha subunit